MTDLTLNRRELLGVAAGAAVACLAGPAAAADPPASPLRLKKAVKFGMIGGELKGRPLAEKFAALKRLGYDGVELDSPGGPDAKEVLAAIDATGLPVHGVVDSVHWNQTLSDPDPAVRAKGLAALQTALRDAKSYGATSVLLVPAVVNAKVFYGDAYTRSQAEIRKAIPLAEELGIRILFENVWNNFLLSPLEAARYVDEFETKVVGAYFDIGNVCRYGWPEQWVAALGPRIGKLDVKGYSRKIGMEQGAGKGFGVEIDAGDIDWPAVREQLVKVGYIDGWATADVGGGGEERLADILKRMRNALDG